jgi:hypothetical protein
MLIVVVVEVVVNMLFSLFDNVIMWVDESRKESGRDTALAGALACAWWAPGSETSYWSVAVDIVEVLL